MRKKNQKADSIIRLTLVFLIIILVNIACSFFFYRFDLTSEKRFTLSEASRKIAGSLKDVLYIKVYLEGDFPAGFKRLRNETREMLDEFRAYSKGNLEYEFINPSENPDQKIRSQVYKQLLKQGLQPTKLEVKEENGNTEKIIFPGAICTYLGNEIPLQLLKSQMGVNPEAMLNNSIQALEYEIANGIQKVSTESNLKIGFTTGHGELEEIKVRDISQALSEYYSVDRIFINEKISALKDYKAIIIAQPDSAFSEKDKFIIDQFIMNGGKVIWLIESVYASMDSLVSSDQTMGIPVTQNLEDQLFKYGVRINTNLIMDIQSAPIPVVTGMIGNQPQQKLFPWFYFPLMASNSNHPIVKNLEVVKGEFTNTIDTVGGGSIKKTPLLQTSKYTRLVTAPARIHLGVLKREPDINQFNRSHQNVAVLLEGKFPSVFKNRIPPEIEDNKDIKYQGESVPNKMIVISDGDIIRNYSTKDGQAYPLGYDKYTNQHYGNRNFILNAVNFLCDDSGLITVRSRELKIRLLDKEKIKTAKLKWQLINTVLPVLLIIICGLIFDFLRKRKFSRRPMP